MIEILLMREGYAYFESWYEELAELENGADPDSTTQTDFLAWQVIMVFTLYIYDTLGTSSHRFASMGVQSRGSYFSQLKYAARGQLSAINFENAQAAVETTEAASTKRPREADYRDAGLDLHPGKQTKKRKV